MKNDKGNWQLLNHWTDGKKFIILAGKLLSNRIQKGESSSDSDTHTQIFRFEVCILATKWAEGLKTDYISLKELLCI